MATFGSVHPTMILPLGPDQRAFRANGVVDLIPGPRVRFENGISEIKDEERIKKLKETPAFKRGEVFEITPGDKETVQKTRVGNKQKVVRGAVTSSTYAEERGSPPEESAEAVNMLSNKGTKCSECGKEFSPDPQGKRLRMHMLSHRKKK